jgi:hypothetical protein
MNLNSSLYDDIINLPRPESNRPHMSKADRAKIFSPFSALKGYNQSIQNMEKVRIDKPERFEEQKEILNRKLNLLERGEIVTVSYFHSDSGPNGSGGTGQGIFQTVTGTVWKIDPVFQFLKINNLAIPFDDIWDIIGECISDL